MNLQTLIDSVVRQTTVLIAQLATAQGVRAPLAHVANQVFLDLAEELSRQGVSRKVSSDMFGLALRTYLRKIQRLNEGATDRGRSLWEAVLEYLQKSGDAVVLRAAVLQRFHLDDVEQVRGVLHDLCESGLVFRLGSGDATGYRCASQDDMDALASGEPGHDDLLWAIVYREGPLSREQLLRRGTRSQGIDAGLERLIAAGRIESVAGPTGDLYQSHRFFVPRGSAQGWEAAVFDHFQALVKTIGARLSAGAEQRDVVGGSTYSFDVWPGHPEYENALATLGAFREQTSALRERIAQFNDNNQRPNTYESVTVYAGQSLVRQTGEQRDDEI